LRSTGDAGRRGAGAQPKNNWGPAQSAFAAGAAALAQRWAGQTQDRSFEKDAFQRAFWACQGTKKVSRLAAERFIELVSSALVMT
jgi:hypothetical protein